MHVRFISEDKTVIDVEGIVWFEDSNMIVNTMRTRYTFSNVVLKDIGHQLDSSFLVEVQGMTVVSSGTGVAPELFKIQIFPNK